MDALRIEGIPAYNGDYPFDMSYYTNRELNLIKTVSGIRAGELPEAFDAGDNDLMVAIAAIAIWRNTGTKPNMDALWDAEAGKFTFTLEKTEEDSEEDALPPSTAPEENDTPADSSPEDGATLNGTSDRLVSVPNPIGVQG